MDKSQLHHDSTGENNYTITSDTIGLVPLQTTTSTTKKGTSKVRRRKNTSIACANCSKWHVSCDPSRPCKRCVNKGLADQCVDAPRKRSKYLNGIPNNALPTQFKKGFGSMDLQFQPQFPQQTKFENVGHKQHFLSLAADSEYSTLATMTQKDKILNRIPITSRSQPQLYPIIPPPNNDNLRSVSSSASLNRNSFTNSTDHSTTNSPRNTTPGRSESEQHSPYNKHSDSIDANSATPSYRSSFRNTYSILLGPHSNEIVESQINLKTNHFPLVPVESDDSSLDFKRLIPEDPSVKGSDLQKNININQYYLNNKSVTFPEVQATFKLDINGRKVSLALECNSPETIQFHSNPEWPHSLRYSTPLEIYTLINEPFSHTPGFHHLYMYLRARFNQDDIIEMCRSIAEFRPIFIACSVTLIEEDMIFMEQCYQRTLLEYARFIELSGTPTCVWRRNGQVSYVNDEFEILTGWKREELLNKMTFLIEILDDESVRDYFKTFSSVAYKDFKGCEKMKVCRILSPIKGQVINCSCLWTLKRDISGLPLMILGNFMPVL